MQVMINIDVSDLKRAIRFYEEAMGLKLRRQLFEHTGAEMEGASCSIYLLEKAAGSRPSAYTDQTRNYARHWTPVHLDFVVSNLEAAIAKAVTVGATLEGALQTFTWGRQACLSDPFGNGICFIQWLGRGYDEVP